MPTHQPSHTISRSAARRIALAAQGFGGTRSQGTVTRRRILELIRQIGMLQLDSVNVFVRAHYMPVFSRLGPYDRALLDAEAAHRSGMNGGAGAGNRPTGSSPPARALVEYWGHEASLLPVELHPLLRWRMARVDDLAWRSIARVAHEHPELVADVLELVRAHGPVRANATGAVRPARQAGEMWNWHAGKRALEHLFFTGRVTAAGRVNFERHYDLVERVLPAAVVAAPAMPEADAQRELVRVGARALGVATEPDLGDYFRLPRTDSKARVAELVDAGELLPVSIEGWTAPAYLWHEARVPRRLAARALLSPFDSLIWFRERVQRLFGFTYRLEIYTPAHRRVHGYYVLPFLLGDRLVARVDLKADRRARALLVRSAFAEAGVDMPEVARDLAVELRLAAEWLGLGSVRVESRGDLAAPLSAAVG